MSTRLGQAGPQSGLAYLVSQYPAVSHTFIRREVAALRRRGIDVATFSIRAPSDADVAGDADRIEADRTYIVLKQSLVALLRSHAWGLISRPARYFHTLRLALRHRPPGLRAFWLALAHFGESILLSHELHRRSIRHLHTHFANSGATVGLLSTRFLRLTWSFVIHGPSETDFPAGYLLGEKIKAADMVICAHWFGCSQGMRLVPPEYWGKFEVVRCGLNRAELPTPAAVIQEERTIVCVGRLAPDKGQAGLLEAFVDIHQRFPDARLKLIGGGPDRERLAALAHDLGLAGVVRFLGPLPEAATLMEIASSEIMVLPSFWEGLPVVLMEAMALGVPVITSRIAGVPELIEDGANGLLFTPGKWSELTECLGRMMGDGELRQKLATAGRERIFPEFDVDTSASQLEKCFAGFTGQSGVGQNRQRSGERNRGSITFGTREAILVGMIGIGIAVAVAMAKL